MAIEKREGKDGKPQYRVRIAHYGGDGKRRNLTIGTYRTKKQAETEERKAIEQRDRGTLLMPDKTTVGELLDEWLEVEVPRTVKPENRIEYEVVIRKHLKPALGHILVRKLTVEQVERLYADLQAAGKSSSLIKKCHMRLSSALRLGKRWGLVAEAITDVITPPRLAYKQAQIWTLDEVSAFLQAAEDDTLCLYWLLALETGARTSELLGVSWNDVDLERGTIRFGEQVVRLMKGTPFVKTSGKTASAHRKIGLSSGMVEELRTHRKKWLKRQVAATEWDNPHDLVFCSPRGKPLNAANVRRTFNRLVKASGVTPIPPHSLRKLHITSTIGAGGNLKAVAARVGHRDLTTTIKTYQQLTAGMEEELMGIVEALAPRREVQA